MRVALALPIAGLALAGMLAAAPSALAIEETVADIAAGHNHSCLVTSCGEVKCFGRNDHGQSANRYVPVIQLWGNPADVFEQVTVGYFHTCGLTTAGDIRCWGRSDHGRLAVPQHRGPFIKVDAGNNHTCALTELGEAVCWGSATGENQANDPPVGLRYTDISAGMSHTCGVTTSNEIVCWGSDSYDQARINLQTAPEAWGEAFTHVSAGYHHTCARSDYGYAYCWGSNSWGQTDFEGRFTDVNGNGVLSYRYQFLSRVTAGAYGTCMRYDSNTSSAQDLHCFGWPYENGGSYTPPNIIPEQLALGTSHACLVDGAGDVHCWGTNTYGKANPPTLDRCGEFEPLPMPTWPFGG